MTDESVRGLITLAWTTVREIPAIEREFMERFVPKMRATDYEIEILHRYIPAQLTEDKLREVIAANVGPPSSSFRPLRSRSSPRYIDRPRMTLFGGQAVVKPAAWTWPSDHSV